MRLGNVWGELGPATGFYASSPCRCKECCKELVYLRYPNSTVKRPKPHRARRLTEVERVQKWRAENPEKSRAIGAVANAIQNYDLERGRCECCRTDKHVCAFHDDYSQPLKVNWRGRPCNYDLRRKAAEAPPSDQDTSNITATPPQP